MSRFFLPGLSILISMLLTEHAMACRGGENTPTDSLESAFKGASTVFVGEVVSVKERAGKDVLATFKVLKSWKGLKSGTISIPVQTGRSCDLGRFVDLGSKWFILVGKISMSGPAKVPRKKSEIIVATQGHSRRFFEPKEEELLIMEIEKFN